MEYIEIYVRMHWENLGDILGCNGIYRRKSWYIKTYHIIYIYIHMYMYR